MALVDDITIRARAGRGGDGVVRWLHEYAREFGGPSGGNGGRGGSIIFRAVRDLNVLVNYRGRSEFKAEDGEAGGNKEKSGKDGADTVIDVPVGAVVARERDGAVFEFLKDGETQTLLAGGQGGWGNAHFKSSTNQYPTEITEGAPGEESAFRIELRIIADVGIVGLPNAGKSSLLNALTAARAKVGSYPFTTLEPNLGTYYGYVLADIPGLIEGAAEGKGLGRDFLRHIERTHALAHCVAADAENPQNDYETVRAEIAGYSEELSRKPEILFLTKADTVSEEELAELTAAFEAKGLIVQAVSVIDDARLKRAGDALIRFLESHR